MPKATKFVARWEGKIVGTRTSPRPYTHAVIVRGVQEYYRKKAYEYVATDCDKSNFKYYGEVVAGLRDSKYDSAEQTAKNRADAAANIEGGFEAYIGRLRQTEIDRYEERVKNGGFMPCVRGWSMSAANAQKMANSNNGPWVEVLGIVKAEVA